MRKENVDCHKRGLNPTKNWYLPCQVCPQIFRSLASFFYHTSSQHLNKLLCPLCLFLCKNMSEYKAHIRAHGGTQTQKSSGPQSPSNRKLCCGTCDDHGSSLERHNKKNISNPDSFTNSIKKQAQVHEDSQESFERSKLAEPTAAVEISSVVSIDETQSEGAAKLSMKTMNIDGETFYCCNICDHKTTRRGNLKVHFLVHTDHRPFRCPIQGCKYRAKSFSYLKHHSKLVHCINNLRRQKNATTLNENSKSGLNCDEQSQVNVNSSANFSMAFACMLCEFIGDSVLAALKHAQHHKPSSS